MTVSYGQISGESFRIFRLLFIWKGSLYKLIWVDYLIWLTLYFVISLLYRFVCNEAYGREFEAWCQFTEKYIDIIPLGFVLGFYVYQMVSRWWDQWKNMPWIDNTATKINYVCPGNDPQSRLIRRTIVRYANLSILLTFRKISSVITKRFPSYEHIVDAGLMTKTELASLKETESKCNYGVWWVPISWATAVAEQAFKCGYIRHERHLLEVNTELILVKDYNVTLIGFDSVRLPIVYTQVVTLAVYFYLFMSLFARQYLIHSPEELPYNDYIFPIFSSIQIFFYLGWLKVGEALLEPLGEDDDDFDINWIIDRGVQVGYLMADDVGRFPPLLEEDKFWKQASAPAELPHTVASLPFRTEHPKGSGEVEVPLEGQKTVIVDNTDSTTIVDNMDDISKPAIIENFVDTIRKDSQSRIIYRL